MKALKSNTSLIYGKIFLFVFLFLFVSQLSVFGVKNLSNSQDDSLWPALAVNSAGEIMVVWLEWSGDNYYRIFKNGQWSSVKNCGIARQRAWTNELAVDSQGMFHLSYADGYASGSRDITYSYFTGSRWASPEKIYQSAFNSAWNKMDIDSNNNIYINWHHSYVGREADPSSDIVLMSKKKMGVWPSTYENISRSKKGPSICPAISVKSGNIYAVWMEGLPRQCYFSEKVGGRWSTPIHLDLACYYLEMDVDDAGNIHVVSGSKKGNFYYKSRIGGKWGPKEIISNGNAPRQHGDVKCKGNVVIATWTQGSNGNWSIWAAGKILGGKWEIPIKIADASGGEFGNKHVQVAIDNTNTAHFVWHTQIGGQDEIFYEKYSVDTPKDATFIEVDNSYLSFHTDDNTSSPGSQTFRVRASGAGSINYSVSEGKSWLSVSPMQGSSSGGWNSHTVNVDASGLSDGAHSGTITITDPSAYNNPVDVGVTLTVGDVGGGGGGGDDGGGGGGGGDDDPGSSYVEADKANLEFSTTEENNPPSQAFNIKAVGGNSLSYSIVSNMGWLSAYPTEGTAGSTWTSISVSVGSENLAAGTFNGRIDIFTPGASRAKTSVFVTLTVEKKQAPYIQINRSYFYFWGYAHGDTPLSNTFKIRNSGSKTLNYKITSNKGWINLSRPQGSSKGEWDTITVSVDSSGLSVYKHKGNIQITASGADNSPQNINVEFEAVMPPQPYAPADITINRLSHEGLIIQEYKNKISWKANPRNQGLFDIVKYRIFRKNQYQSNSPLVYVNEVASNVFTYYDGGFSSVQERNKYLYIVVSVDSVGRESLRAEILGVGAGSVPISSEIKDRTQKNKEIKKTP